MADWLALQASYPRDNDMPARAFRLNALTSVLNGTQYDSLRFPFSMERSDAGEYVPLSDRRPSVKSGLCRSVVDDSVSLVFGEDHFPAIVAKQPQTVTSIAVLIRECCLPQAMIEAATTGSVGSVAILLQTVDHRPAFTVMPTADLTPKWQKARPRLLESVQERYKVKGSDLRVQGYAVADDDLAKTFWFQRIWDQEAETWFVPQPVTDAKESKAPQVDAERSVIHGLGFVPIVWMRNPGGSGPDGGCTFEAAIDTVMEVDYLLSQGGRGLKFASDPTLVIKDPAAGLGTGGAARVGGSATALTVPPEGDAKLLEINGHAAATVLDQVRYLRSLALEAIHGNRADSDRVTAAQSGTAITMMHWSLCQLASRLRLSYGENGLLTLLRMVCDASNKIEGGLTIGEAEGVRLDATDLELRWPPYFRPTNTDLLQTTQALVTAVTANVLSRETAITTLATMFDVDDAEGEFDRVKVDMDQAAQQAAALAATTAAATADRNAANAGKTETRQVTA